MRPDVPVDLGPLLLIVVVLLGAALLFGAARLGIAMQDKPTRPAPVEQPDCDLGGQGGSNLAPPKVTA